jgi:intein-encoded DNA endonuclease-like protein
MTIKLYVQYMKKRQEMVKLYEEMKKMRPEVVKELRKEGLSYDIIVSMINVSKGDVIRFAKNSLETFKKKRGKL